MSEQTVIDILYFLLHDLFETLAYYFIMTLMLTPKYKKAIFLSVTTVVSIVCQHIMQTAPTPVYFLCYVAVMWVPALLFFKEKKKICFFALGILTTGTVACDMILSAFFMKLYGYYPSKINPYNWNSVIATIMTDILFSAVFTLIVVIWRKKIKKYSVKSMVLFMFFPAGQALFIAACTYPTWAMGSTFKVFDNPFMVIAAVISLVSDIMMFIALRDNNSLEAARARAEWAEKEMEHQLQYYNELTEKMTEIREYRHDINNLVAVAEALITENSSQNSRDFIGEMKHKAEVMRIPVYSSSEIANTVLWQKEREAKEAGVELTVKIDIKEDFPLDKIDVCSLLANLLDNAVEEAKETEGKTVAVTVGRKFGLLMIEVVNSANEELRFGGKRKPASSKTGDHGHGLEIVEKIAEKYGGKFVFEAEGGLVKAGVSLSVN